jgi:peptidoglycan/xylan/chitin deacetylase (PgdA/CDA1 family)
VASDKTDTREGWWARHASTRRDLVRTGYDVYRWLEQSVSTKISVPRGGFPPSQLHTSGPTTSNAIALTFDDGPDPDLTPRVLDELGARNLKATFYVLGRQAEKHPEIVKRAFDEGHEIGTHTWSHRFLTTQTSKSILKELRTTDDLIQEITSARPVTLRPPYGGITKSLAAWTAHEFGYATVLWSVDSKDYDGIGTELITKRILDGAQAGSIVLTHDPLAETLAALPHVLDQLVDRGFVFTTVEELISVA